VSSPWWNALTTGLGGLLALGGVALAQGMTNRREERRDNQRHQRDRDEKRADQMSQVLLDMAAYAHHLLVVVDRLADPQRSESFPDRPELVHLDLLTARARVYAPEPLVRVWLRLVDAEVALELAEREGGLPIDRFFGSRYLPVDDQNSVVIRLAGETVVWLVGNELNPRRSDGLLATDAGHVARVVLDAIDQVWDVDADQDVAVAVVKAAFQLVAPEKAPVGLR
jgi:hypothetical protein